MATVVTDQGHVIPLIDSYISRFCPKIYTWPPISFFFTFSILHESISYWRQPLLSIKEYIKNKFNGWLLSLTPVEELGDCKDALNTAKNASTPAFMNIKINFRQQ
jgi:hypothetical protein